MRGEEVGVTRAGTDVRRFHTKRYILRGDVRGRGRVRRGGATTSVRRSRLPSTAIFLQRGAQMSRIAGTVAKSGCRRAITIVRPRRGDKCSHTRCGRQYVPRQNDRVDDTRSRGGCPLRTLPAAGASVSTCSPAAVGSAATRLIGTHPIGGVLSPVPNSDDSESFQIYCPLSAS